ncbi:uncharacterized protein LOC106717634 [Papilio machaon]|uniref:uncharacterized protein LOC106717634 n=1 Tax=Papilio machaon TaxID=76193 RepID=UPI001E663C77|nr:uncharacterized protein LOC106717634 [Papilio machaon]
MPLTQEKRLDSNFANNNDQSYLHKKFKKMASTISGFPANGPKCEENRQKETITLACNTSISNGSIAAAHPEIEKIKEQQEDQSTDVENDVQINFNAENIRLSDVNNVVQVTGKTSFTEEFLNKTENLENDFIRECYSGGTGRYMCPYCKLSCAKPSVLQKHIRAHTNERPYPCIPCGFAFKTRSNLYKHRRSRTHALRLQGTDISGSINEEDMSGGSESDTSIPPTSLSDTGSDASVIRLDYNRSNEISSPELTNDSHALPVTSFPTNDYNKSKAIYKPKFRAAFYQGIDERDKIKKTISTNADFLTEHISKIISDNEAIVDVIETPLQKKYGKIKQIAESKQFLNESELKQDASPLNLTKNNFISDSSFRKRSHSESFSQVDDHKHPLNPEGSIIKDLLLKSKNNTVMISGELIDGLGVLYVCPLCQIIFRSVDNLETHRLYYCKGNIGTNSPSMNAPQKEVKVGRPENVYTRSNSINVRLPETQSHSPKLSLSTKSPISKSKPDNLVILKQESNEIIAPLPSPGPLLGNTRLVDARTPTEFHRKTENIKIKSKEASPKRRIESRSDTFSPRILENISPRSADLYPQSKIRCVDINAGNLRSIEELSSHIRHNSTSLQMFGGEVKIVDHSGSTTTLRIEPSKNQLSPILIQQNLSPSKFATESEASSVVVRSGLHSGGTIVHNPPTPKDVLGTPQPQSTRMSISTSTLQNSNLPNIHDISHFPFPPLSAITAYNPLTLPPLSPTSSPNGATTILHGGKLIPHVPGMPGPNTAAAFIGSGTMSQKITCTDKHHPVPIVENNQDYIQTGKVTVSNYEKALKSRSPSSRSLAYESDKYNHNLETYKGDIPHYMTNIPTIKVKNIEEPNSHSVAKTYSSNIVRIVTPRQELTVKRNSDGMAKISVLKENTNNSLGRHINKDLIPSIPNINVEVKSENDIRNFNFENLITKAEIYNNQIQSSSEVQKNTNVQETIMSSVHNERSETSYFQKNSATRPTSDDRKPKFLRPSTLPLKPGTFTPKRHHGITPNANTMPLVSPETPRPAKAYGQLYLNGNAYTYLGLKCSTKVFYCTINRPQPTYVPNQHFLSMYSNWQLLSELTPDPLGLSASSAMSLYDSRHRPQNVTTAVIKQDLILTHSSQSNKKSKEYYNQQAITSIDSRKSEESKQQPSDISTSKKELTGGFESNEEYTYVRGRGRGRYVCSECGIRCKKPSMLKKHIRTHTDVRPYTCTHCAFSFKTKGNLTKHMKSKAHYKKCCELGINPNEGNEEGSEMTHCSGETDDETDSDGDEGNEGETESSDTELYKSRLPEHEAAHCLLSLGGCRTATSATPGLITSARPTTYPYTPVDMDSITSDSNLESTPMAKTNSVDVRLDVDNEPMDLSRNDVKAPNLPEIPTAKESSVLASLASNTAKLPQQQSQWSNGEPMLHTYLTERALLDSKIKQSQLTSNLSKLRKIDIDKSTFIDADEISESNNGLISNNITTPITSSQVNISKPIVSSASDSGVKSLLVAKEEIARTSTDVSHSVSYITEPKRARTPNNNSENAKHVVSEYLKHARINLIKTRDETYQNQTDNNSSDESNSSKMNTEEKSQNDDITISESESLKMPPIDHDPVARKVVIGAGGVAFKVTKGKDFEGAPYSPGRLMEDGRRVCDFCNKTFTKPSQLRLHLNIHYMERPFRCSVCAVSFRTRGHLQKHERSGSHHNKVSMTSTFGTATSFNPRPFRCSDCNIAFRIHGHLAKHLRSKMHVMRLECLFKLPFGTFTEIERAGVSLTDIDTTDCASSLASLQSLARKLHEKDPTKLEYREPNGAAAMPPAGRESSEDEDGAVPSDNACDNERDSEMKTMDHSDGQDVETRINYSATDN